jgi:serine/threonine-protein kinase
LTPSVSQDGLPDEQSVSALDEITARAQREVQTMGECRSQHIVKLGPIGLGAKQIAAQNVIYFSEEWITGRDLRQVLRERTRLDIQSVVSVGLQITEAVEELWSHRKIHRDIKPGNIMQRKENDFVLLDLGLVFDLEDSSLTGFGVVPGTPRYYSPEQLDYPRKRQMDFRSDLFSLGLTLYEVSTGVHPFWSQGKDTRQVWANILGATPVPPRHHRPEIPPVLQDIILRLIAKKPHLRFRTCDRLRQALQRVII